MLIPDYPFMRCWRCKARSELIQQRYRMLWDWFCPSCFANYSYHPGHRPFFRCLTPDPTEVEQIRKWKPRQEGQDTTCEHARYVGGVTRFVCERAGGCLCNGRILHGVIAKKYVRMLVHNYTKAHLYRGGSDE